jgi:Ala-tRNA(Pro) deacylase
MATAASGPGCRRAQLFCTLGQLGIKTETFPYVADAPCRTYFQKGILCKNLFLKDRKGQFYLVIIPESAKIDLKYLKQILGAYRNFSFGKEDELDRLLGTTPGCVTPLGIGCDVSHELRIIIDESLTSDDALLNFHPFVPWLTTVLSFNDLHKLISHSHHQVEVINLI